MSEEQPTEVSEEQPTEVSDLQQEDRSGRVQTLQQQLNIQGIADLDIQVRC